MNCKQIKTINLMLCGTHWISSTVGKIGLFFLLSSTLMLLFLFEGFLFLWVHGTGCVIHHGNVSVQK